VTIDNHRKSLLAAEVVRRVDRTLARVDGFPGIAVARAGHVEALLQIAIENGRIKTSTSSAMPIA
jgi:hypothetical protein